MAIVKAPLLSLGARGQLGKSLVFSGWKGLKTVREHVVPANPQTAAQITQRDLVTVVVAAWKNYYTGVEARAAWNRSALNDSRPMSGFNQYSSNALKKTALLADASFSNLGEAIAGNLVSWDCLNIDVGDAGDEAGTFEIWVGDTISGMVLTESIALAGGAVIGTIDQGDAGDLKYAKIRKDGFDRSGISFLTLTD